MIPNFILAHRHCFVAWTVHQSDAPPFAVWVTLTSLDVIVVAAEMVDGQVIYV
jgi:hypothetical protein